MPFYCIVLPHVHSHFTTTYSYSSTPFSCIDFFRVIARFSMQDNITAVVEAFTNYFELDVEGYESIKVAILRRALDAMAPGE